MDVSTTSAATSKSSTPTTRPARGDLPGYREVCCDVCGYPRTGLPPGALCPECGHPPAVAIAPVIELVGAARNRSEQAWLASVGLGLVLLTITSILATQVTLIMPLGGLVLPAVNAPGPKLCAAALLQRSIGNPGPWGVAGTLAVLGNILAIWLITEPRSVLAIEESQFSLRFLARWTCVIAGGAMVGAMFAGVERDWRWGWYSLPSVLGAVALVELPANSLLYWYLASLAKRFDRDEPAAARSRAAILLRSAGWMIPIVCIVGTIMSALRGLMQDKPVEPWRIAQCIYGSAAVATGMIMTAGVLYLTVNVLAGSVDRSVASLAGKIAGLGDSLRRVVREVRDVPARWAVVAGLILWLWDARPMVGLAAMIEHRRGLGGDLPAINFIGPKIWGVPLLEGSPYYYFYGDSNRLAVVSVVLAVWLMTARMLPGFRPGQRLMTRWLPTILIGIALGLAITIHQAPQARESYWAAGFMICVEAPATLAVYRYLSVLAGAIGETMLSRQLKWIGWIATVLILSPLVFYVLSRPLRAFDNSIAALIAGAAYGALAVGAGVLAWALLVRLTWAIATSRSHEPEVA